MLLATMHREDVVATIRKRFGSVAAFERKLGLPTKSVNEVLRGRPNARVSDAVETLLADNDPQTEGSGNSDKSRASLCLSDAPPSGQFPGGN